MMADAAAAVAGAAASLPPGSYPLSTTANSFLAGVLEHVPALLPFTAPSVNSFERFKPSCWSGAAILACDDGHAMYMHVTMFMFIHMNRQQAQAHAGAQGRQA
jgi:hypothetical protein